MSPTLLALGLNVAAAAGLWWAARPAAFNVADVDETDMTADEFDRAFAAGMPGFVAYPVGNFTTATAMRLTVSYTNT